MTKKTPLYDAHVRAGAKMVDFAGWMMPVNYGSQIEEHHQVRKDAGVFDVSHMTIVDIHGEETKKYLQCLLANNVDKLKTPGKALYSCMLNEEGGVIDDLIVYKFADDFYRIVVNAATRDNDLDWMEHHASPLEITMTERTDLAMVAVQGPNAHEKVLSLLSAEQRQKIDALKPFTAAFIGDWQFARTGYTGEDGFEIMLPVDDVDAYWQRLLEVGVKPIGLGARDTLRMEAGMNLYGNDMTDETSPLTSGLSWTIAWKLEERDFIGRTALEKQREQGVQQHFVGLILQDKGGILRAHQKVITADGEGETTSGTFSPTLQKSIGLARIPSSVRDECYVEIRGKQLLAKIVKPVFVRKGQNVIEPLAQQESITT